MHANHTPLAIVQHVEIAFCLGKLHHAESEFAVLDRNVFHMIASYGQEYTAVRASLIGLARRMEITRTEFEAGRDMFPVANSQPEILKQGCMIRRRRPIGGKREVILLMQAREMRAQAAGK